MRALVTGAAGFIGSHVVDALVQAGHEVRALHLRTDDQRNLRRLDCERIEGDVTDLGSLERAAQGCEVVFHLAAIYALWGDVRRMRAVNVQGTRNVLAVARRVGARRVVHTSSIARFGGQGRSRRATEASPFALGRTGDRYSQSKADAHEVALAAAAEQDVVIVAPCGPIGPGDVHPTPTGRLLLSTLSMPVALVADTMTTFADVRDMARAHVLAAEKGRRGETYLLGTADLSMEKIARLALRAAGKRKPILVAQMGVASAAAHGMKLWADRVTHRPPLFTPAAIRIARRGLRADCTKARDELGMPQTPIEIAVNDALEWWSRAGMR